MRPVDQTTLVEKKISTGVYDETIAKHVAKLYKQSPLTNFSDVTPDTNLNSLNLNWREHDLPERVRTKHVHRLHPYMGKFIPQLVEIFLRKFEPKLVYDPFCGSGTTLVEANVLGIDSVGTDISAFNAMLSRVKTFKYDIELLHKELFDILDKLFQAKNKLKSIKKYDSNNGYLNEWFADQSRRELLYYLSLIKNYKCRGLLKVILSRAARSSRLVTHYDLDFPKNPQKGPYYCHKHSRTCYPVQEAYKFLNRYTIDTYERVKEFNTLRTDANVTVIHGDSRKVQLPDGIDLVFTSPPYVGLIDYHEQHRYAFELLGFANNEGKEIGPAKKGQSDNAKKDYIDGINQVLAHTRNYMKRNGKMIIVINDKYNLYNAEDVGFKPIGRVERHVNRRTGRRNGAFYESILIWEKI